jgi:hypothetical protein
VPTPANPSASPGADTASMFSGDPIPSP